MEVEKIKSATLEKINCVRSLSGLKSIFPERLLLHWE